MLQSHQPQQQQLLQAMNMHQMYNHMMQMHMQGLLATQNGAMTPGFATVAGGLPTTVVPAIPAAGVPTAAVPTAAQGAIATAPSTDVPIAAVNPEGNLDSLLAFNVSNMGDSLFGILFDTQQKTQQMGQAQAQPEAQAAVVAQPAVVPQAAAVVVAEPVVPQAVPAPAAQQQVVVVAQPPMVTATMTTRAAAAARAPVDQSQFVTPAKGARPASAEDVDMTPVGGDSILRMPLEKWAGLSPPPNFKLPPEFGANSPMGMGMGGADFAGMNSLLLPHSLLGFPEGGNGQIAAATAMQKGVEALFQQVAAAPAVVTNLDENLAAVAPPRGDTCLHSLTSLLEKSNSNWMAAFESAQKAEPENKKPAEEPAMASGSDGSAGARHFAVLFGG